MLWGGAQSIRDQFKAAGANSLGSRSNVERGGRKSKQRLKRKAKKMPFRIRTRGCLAIHSNAAAHLRRSSSLIWRSSSASSSGKPLSNHSVSNEVIGWRSCMFLKDNPNQIAKGVWEFGKVLGLKNKGPEGEVVGRLNDMELRDRLAAGSRGY